MEREIGRTAERSLEARSLSEKLGTVVDAVIEEVGTFRVGLHAEALRGLTELLAATEVEALLANPDAALGGQFDRHPWAELFYLMDASGVQVSSNLVNPRYADLMSTDGKGVQRADKPYFRVVSDSGKPFISDIYLSSASKNLCLTVSVPVFDGHRLRGVLAADVAVADFSRLSNPTR